MILPPRNDTTCLGAITEIIRKRVATPEVDRSLAALARELGSTAALRRWIREQRQRDDHGDPSDGPKVAACQPVQRLRVPAQDPNCVERAALYLGVAELIDPGPARHLESEVTPSGLLHTFPVEDGARIVLDPIVGELMSAPGLRNGGGDRQLRFGPVRIALTPEIDRALRVAARAARYVEPRLATQVATVALAAAGVPPALVVPIEHALRERGLTIGLFAAPARVAAHVAQSVATPPAQ